MLIIAKKGNKISYNKTKTPRVAALGVFFLVTVR